MLEVRGLKAGYRQVPVLFGIDLDLAAGEILAVVGRNGMGKTTLLKALMGLLPLSAGSVSLDGAPVSALPPFAVARKGVAYVPQGREIFAELSVAQNLRLGALAKGEAAAPAALLERFPILAERARQPAGTLSGGEQQQLAIARALAGRPRLLLLDEPAEGIQPSIVERIGRDLRDLAAKDGLAILLVEQSIDLVLDTADRVAVMERGRIVAEIAGAALSAAALEPHLGV